MIQLYTDYATNRILGFNRILPEDTRDIILVDENTEGIDKISNLKFNKKLYYIDGKIIEKNDEENELIKKLQEADRKYSNMNTKVKNEQTIFMDNIISGMSVEQAAKISVENREALAAFEREKKELEGVHQEAIQNAVIRKFEKEEEKINYKYFLSMLAIVRDENDYLEEWIRYHINLGFEHFYIYDNESAVPVKDYLESAGFEHLDKLTILDWNTSGWSQQDAYNDFLEKYKNETKWIFTADPDEFIFIKDNTKGLKDFLEENSQYASIKCLWQHFNANGHEKKTDEPVLKRFTKAVHWDGDKRGGKKFAQTNRILNYRSYVPQLRMETRHLEYDSDIVTDYFQLNHYYTKSYEEWLEKIKRGSVNPHYLRKYADFFELNPDMEYLNTGENAVQGYGPADN